MGRRARVLTGNALDRVQKKAAKFAHHRNDSNSETLTERRKIARLCALFKAYTGEQAWKAIGDRSQAPLYLSRGGHSRKLGAESSGQISGNTPL
jgi:hypothetical protein